MTTGVMDPKAKAEYEQNFALCFSTDLKNTCFEAVDKVNILLAASHTVGMGRIVLSCILQDTDNTGCRVLLALKPKIRNKAEEY